MNKLLLSLLAVLLTTAASAQLTLSSAYFPVAGDTLRSVVADSTYAVGVDLQPGGGENLRWDFSEAVGVRTVSQAVTAINITDFPTATLRIAGDDTAESFYQSSPTSFDLVGVRASFDLLPGFPVVAEVQPVRPVRRAPLAFGASFSSMTENTVTISVDSLPEALRQEIGPALNGVDSLRLTTISTRNDEVDAWGTVDLPEVTYPVLREKRTESVFIRLEVRSLPLPWIDVTGSITVLNPDLADLLGQQPLIVNYLFWTEGSKEPVADITTSEMGQVQQMRYKRAATTTATGDRDLQQAIVRLYPNPASVRTRLEVAGVARGTYHLHLVNMVGRQVAARSFQVNGGQAVVDLDVSTLTAGLYLYTLRNEQGRALTTKRLLVK